MLAIRDAVHSVGRFDGTPASADRARQVFVDLATRGLYPVIGQPYSIDELAEGFVGNLRSDSGPILLEAAWTVVGAARLQGVRAGLTPAQALRFQSIFAMLFEGWVKRTVKRYRVGTVAAQREMRERMAMVVAVLADRFYVPGSMH